MYFGALSRRLELQLSKLVAYEFFLKNPMTSQFSDGRLSEAVFRAVQDGVYPEEETIVSAELPSSAFDSLQQLLEQARAEVKVRDESYCINH